MGSVSKRSSGRWRPRYRDPSKWEHARDFRRRLDAERWLASMSGGWPRWRLQGSWRVAGPGPVQVHLRGLGRALAGRTESAAALDVCQIRPHPDEPDLANLGAGAAERDSHADVVAWVGDLVAKGYAPATVRQSHRVFSLALTLAIRDGRLSRNVAQGVRLPRVPRQDKTFLTHDQVSRLAAAAGPYALHLSFLAYTGLRWGEFAPAGQACRSAAAPDLCRGV